MEENKSGRSMGLWGRAVGAVSAMGIAVVLSGGGGGDKAPTNSTLPPVVDPSATSQSVFALNLVDQSIDGVNSEALQVVDMRNGTVALTVDGQASGSGRVESTYTSRYAFTGGTTGRYDGISQLFTVEGHRLKQRDLRGKSVGTAQTVSSLNTVCTAYHVHALNKEGDQGWVEVVTGTTAADCSTAFGVGTGGGSSPAPAPAPATSAGVDSPRSIAATTTSTTEARLVPFGVAGADTVMLAGSQGLNWVSNLYNQPDEPAIGILAIDRSKGLLNVYSTGLKRVLSNVVLPLGPLSAADNVSIEGTLPTNPSRSLLRIGAKLYLATITGKEVSLGNVVRTLKSATSFDAITDGQNLYFADGNTLVQVNAAGTLKPLTPPLPTGVRVGNLHVTGGSLVFTQTNSLGVTLFVSAYALDTGKLTTLVTDEGMGFAYRILRAEDGVVWIESTDPGTRRSEVNRVKVDRSALQGVMGGIVRVALLSSSSFTFGSAPQATAVLWCEVPEGVTGCLNLWQTELVSGASVLLGQVPIDAGWTWNNLYERGGTTDDRPGLLSLGQTQLHAPGGLVSNQKVGTL